jgi:hypothetical protein
MKAELRGKYLQSIGDSNIKVLSCHLCVLNSTHIAAGSRVHRAISATISISATAR